MLFFILLTSLLSLYLLNLALSKISFAVFISISLDLFLFIEFSTKSVGIVIFKPLLKEITILYNPISKLFIIPCFLNLEAL